MTKNVLRRKGFISAVTDRFVKEKNNEKALSLIASVLANSASAAVQKFEAAKKMCSRLYECYSEKTAVNKLSLFSILVKKGLNRDEHKSHHVTVLESQLAR